VSPGSLGARLKWLAGPKIGVPDPSPRGISASIVSPLASPTSHPERYNGGTRSKIMPSCIVLVADGVRVDEHATMVLFRRVREETWKET